ncbi:MAG: hypothetical protein E5V21_01740 [Mesorhizobium sp.]|nr:MAG: hypothetical protein E5V21_01740 [Mesorhizobium sp.]
MARTLAPFVMVIADHDKKEFSVEGPMTDDTRWNKAIAAVNKGGRNINCSTTEASVERAAADHASQYGYKRVPAGSVVSRS